MYACASLTSFQQNQTKPDIEFVGFKVNREQQIKGRNIMLTATANMKLMGINDLIYCGVSDNFDCECIVQLEFE